jgi:hypothetical protein
LADDGGLYSRAQSVRWRHAEKNGRDEAVAGRRGRAWKRDEGRRRRERWRAVIDVDFKLFTELPLEAKFKLLSNLQQKLKICKNKSCSIFKDLQLSQYEHFPIRLSF